MIEYYIFMDGLSKAIGLRQGVIPRDKIPDRVCSQISVFNDLKSLQD